jgi:hypothetical protein
MSHILQIISQYFQRLPIGSGGSTRHARDMDTSFTARARRTSRAHIQPFARYSPEAFSIIGFRPASIIFGFSGLQMM